MQALCSLLFPRKVLSHILALEDGTKLFWIALQTKKGREQDARGQSIDDKPISRADNVYPVTCAVVGNKKGHRAIAL